MKTYLKRFYFDDRRLRQRALIELVWALESGRLIAFTGSMATENQGYGAWSYLIGKYMQTATELAEDDVPEGLGRLEKLAVERMRNVAARDPSFDKRVALSVVKEALAALDRAAPRPNKPSRVKDLESSAGSTFGSRDLELKKDTHSTIEALIKHLGIRRYATLNYDLELEVALMVEPNEMSVDEQPLEVIQKLQDAGKIESCSGRVSHRLSRLMTNGRMVESDIRDRERPDRMIEFAVGSAEIDQRIMHLHGRACSSETMIVGLRDYDRLYRRDDQAKLPFEHGQRILFAGNPIIFVGVGMSEPEVNATLQTFVSNNPYRRFAPTFLLWNTVEFSSDKVIRADQIAAKRIDFLQRLGIFTIFDEDLVDDGQFASRIENARLTHHVIAKIPDPTLAASLKVGLRDRKLELLADSVRQLASTAGALHAEFNYEKNHWRSMQTRLSAKPLMGPVTVWGIDKEPSGNPLSDEILEQLSIEWPPESESKTEGRDAIGSTCRIVIGPSGAGKGSFGWRLGHQVAGSGTFTTPLANRLLINAGFAFDTDSLLTAISRFLLKLQNEDWAGVLNQSREVQFASSGAFKLPNGKRAIIIINGMERFFTITGAPLSAELDHLLRRVAGLRYQDSDITWYFLGPERTRRYFEMLGAAWIKDSRNVFGDPNHGELLASAHLNDLLQKFEAAAVDPTNPPLTSAAQAVLKNQARAEHESIRRAAYGAFLDPGTLVRAGVQLERVGLALEILRAMAFIGSPVEDVVLLHAPRVRRALGNTDRAKTLADMLDKLIELGLVVHLRSFEDNPDCDPATKLWRRFGLHPSLTSELRYQFGVPLSESKLSTAFNMSLYVAQPVDGYVPEPAIHDELAELIDFLIGAYKDELETCELPDITAWPGALATLDSIAAEFTPPLPDNERTAEHLRRLIAPSAVAALRTALAVLRGYYSTTSLLTIDRGDRLAAEDRDGVLHEHAERLQRLIWAHTKLSRFREALLRRAGTQGYPDEKAMRKIIGAEPFYPDDLVWMHNELAVVALTQGDLYGARSALRQAFRVNRRAVEFDSRSHNWRRITINQIFLDIERARLASAERKLADVERSINQRPRLDMGDTGLKEDIGRFAKIRQRWGQDGDSARHCFDRNMMHEELLMTALVLGYRGICHHVRGHLLSALPLYEDALAILRRLEEHRAYANFQRHYAQLQAELDPQDTNSVHLRLAIAAAESVRQMDMAYYARIIQAMSQSNMSADTGRRRAALQQLNDAFSYSALMDLHRLRIEVAGRLARVKLHSGDYETALEHATEAMAIASRHGHSLRKIGVRILIGQILIRRGDPKSGQALIESAVEVADRFGYQRAVEVAQRVRAEEGVQASAS